MTGSRGCQSKPIFLVGQAPQGSSLRVVSFPGIGRLTPSALVLSKYDPKVIVAENG
jgi:hypothetical protein